MEQVSCLNSEITKGTSLQRELYDEKTIQDPKHPESWSEVRSIFYWEYIRRARAGHTYLKMNRKPVSDHYTFEVDPHFNYLLATDLWQQLPEIRVDPKYKDTVQICYPKDLGLAIVQEAYLATETTTIQKLDYIWINMVAQHMFNIDRSQLDKMIGNVPELTNWTDRLPRYLLTIPQFWDYSRDYGTALPIGLAHKDTISHIYKVRTRIASILRVRIKQGQTWVETRLDACRLKGSLLDDVDLETKLPSPELYASYAMSNPSEWEWRQEQPNVLYTQDMELIPGELRYEAGKKVQINLDVESPCSAIFFVAEPTKALDSNNFGNFTTDPSNSDIGTNPIKTVGLMYGLLSKLPAIDSVYTSRIVPSRYFPVAPYRKGYNAICIGFSPSGIDADTTSSLKQLGAKLVLEFHDIDPVSDEGDDLDDELTIKTITNYTKVDLPTYNVHIRLLVYRKISFRDGKCIVEGVTH